MEQVINEALAASANQARKILSTASSPGWKVIEHSIVRMMQSLMPQVLLEDEKGVIARSRVRAYQDVLNLLSSKVQEAQATLAEVAKAEDKDATTSK